MPPTRGIQRLDSTSFNAPHALVCDLYDCTRDAKYANLCCRCSQKAGASVVELRFQVNRKAGKHAASTTARCNGSLCYVVLFFWCQTSYLVCDVAAETMRGLLLGDGGKTLFLSTDIRETQRYKSQLTRGHIRYAGYNANRYANDTITCSDDAILQVDLFSERG